MSTDLHFSRVLPASRDLVWACWTDPALIPLWFMPKPHRTRSVEIDLRVGGRFNTTFLVEGQEMENTGVYLEVVPQTRLVFTDGYSEGWKPAPDPFMTAILDLEDDGAGGTLYTATARHRSPEARKSHEDMGFHDGWGTVADQLERYAQSLS